jgi:hypothetical protein
LPNRISYLQQIEKIILFASYFYGYLLDPYVVLSPIRGAAGDDGFRVQPFGDGSSRFIQPVQVKVA